MLFDIVLMRRDGRQRLRADLLREMPVRGQVLTRDTGSRDGVIATLTVDGSPVWQLGHCRVTRITSGSLVLIGVEDVPDGQRQVQAWWCRLPPHGSHGPRPFDPDPPSAVKRDLSYSTGRQEN